MDGVCNQSLNSISFGNSVANQNKAWLNKSGVSDKMNQQRVNSNYTLNAMAEQQSSTAWGKKTKNKDYLRLKIEHLDISKESSKSE
jgi:hypothetical protein